MSRPDTGPNASSPRRGNVGFVKGSVGEGVVDLDDVGVERLGVDKSLSPLDSPRFKPSPREKSCAASVGDNN